MKNRYHVSRKSRRSSRKNYTTGFSIPGMDMAHGKGHSRASLNAFGRLLKALGFGSGFLGGR